MKVRCEMSRRLLVLIVWLTLGFPLHAQTASREGLPSVAEGKQLPDSSFLLTLKNDTVYFHQLKGQWLLLDYWSTSCRPCIKEMPHVRKLSQAQADLLTVVMINLDNHQPKWERGIRKFNPPSPHYRAAWNRENALTALNLVWLKQENGSQKLVTLLAQYVLIAPDGTIIDKNMPKPSDPNFSLLINRYQREFNDGG